MASLHVSIEVGFHASTEAAEVACQIAYLVMHDLDVFFHIIHRVCCIGTMVAIGVLHLFMNNLNVRDQFAFRVCFVTALVTCKIIDTLMNALVVLLQFYLLMNGFHMPF